MVIISRDLLVRGKAAAKVGDKAEARFYLERALEENGAPDEDKCEAWYWLSMISESREEQRKCLEEILSRNLGDARARRKLAILDGKLKPDEIIDPDQTQQNLLNGVTGVSGTSFTCPQCGGRMQFAPDGQSYVCEFCETAQKLSQSSESGLSLEEDNFIAALATSKGHFKPVSMRLFACKGCGSKFIMPPRQITLKCPYCTSRHVVAQAEEEEIISPHSLIPFKINEQRARLALAAWFEEKGFATLPRVEPGFGLYFPTWTFDVGGQISWSCLVQVSEGRRRDWVPTSGTRSIYIDDIKVLATTRLQKRFATVIDDYDLNELEAYDPRFLSNFLAESYQIPMGNASLEARRIALENERKSITLDFIEPMRDLTLKTAGMIVESFRLILLPAWMTRYYQDESIFKVLINGQNGNVFGELPNRGILGWLKGQ